MGPWWGAGGSEHRRSAGRQSSIKHFWNFPQINFIWRAFCFFRTIFLHPEFSVEPSRMTGLQLLPPTTKLNSTACDGKSQFSMRILLPLACGSLPLSGGPHFLCLDTSWFPYLPFGTSGTGIMCTMCAPLRPWGGYPRRNDKIRFQNHLDVVLSETFYTSRENTTE